MTALIREHSDDLVPVLSPGVEMTAWGPVNTNHSNGHTSPLQTTTIPVWITIITGLGGLGPR